MNDSFDDELRRSLHKQADGLPRVPDLSKGAISRAHGIRRRRQVAGIAAAAALVAIAVPIGLRVGDVMSNGQDPIAPATTGPTLPTPTATPTATGPTDPTQSAPTTPDESDPTTPGDTGPSTANDTVQVSLDLQAMPQGDAPAVPVLHGRTITGSGFEVEVPGSGFIGNFVAFDDGAYVQADDAGSTRLFRLAGDGAVDDLGEASSSGFAASPDGRWFAYSTNENGERRLVLVDEVNDETSTLTLPGRQRAYVVSVVDGTVYYSSELALRPLYRWSAGQSKATQVADVQANAVSPDGGLVVHFTADPAQDEDSCGAVLDVASGSELWERCALIAKSFSPDGSLVVASGEVTDGYAPTSLAVLDAESGDVVRRFEPATDEPISFRNAVFEDETHLIVHAEQAGGTALVRCDVETGDCEAAEPWTDGADTDLRGGPFDLPGTL